MLTRCGLGKLKIVARASISNGRSSTEIDAAAQIWAEATARRDGDTEVPTLNQARPVIEDAMNQSPSSVLLFASSADGQPEGFALLAPTQFDELQVELRYLGVRPAAWGRSVASTLLEAVATSVRDGHHTGAELWVYEDNARACLLYERHGWRPDGTPRTHNRSGRVERRYVLDASWNS